MKADYQDYSNFEHWRLDNNVNVARVPEPYQFWLTDRGSLTSALVALSNGNFKVKVLRQQIAVPRWHEQRKLNRALQLAAMIREVELHIHGVAVVFARSIIPMPLIRMGKTSLGGLGTAPLGYFLFKAGKIRISKREIASIPSPTGIIYARRTPYDYKGSTVLVSEFFLPEFDRFI